jgi:hypothetical protein
MVISFQQLYSASHIKTALHQDNYCHTPAAGCRNGGRIVADKL